METKSDTDQFLTLQEKSELELRAIAEGMGLKAQGSKGQLVSAILELGIKQQYNVLVAQALPLRTRDNDGTPFDDAIAAFKNWRRLIFEAKGNRKQFQLINSKGKTYLANLKYADCSEATLLHILTEGWLLPLENQRDLVALLKQKPSEFKTTIIQKPATTGNSWLMLHISPKTKAA